MVSYFLHYPSAGHGGRVTPSQLEICGENNSSTVVRNAQFQITGNSAVWWKCCPCLCLKWAGVNDVRLNEEPLGLQLKVYLNTLSRRVSLSVGLQLLCHRKIWWGCSCLLRSLKYFSEWIHWAMNFCGCFRAMFSREQRENALNLTQVRLQGDMLHSLKGTKRSTATCMSFCTFGNLVAYTA